MSDSTHDGSKEDKSHLFWVLDPPARTKDEVDRLWVVSKKLKAALDGGDGSVQPVHPMRAAGTVHTKTAVNKLSHIFDVNERTIALEEAEAALKDVDLNKTKTRGTDSLSGAAQSGPQPLDVAKTIEEILTGGVLHTSVTALSASLINRRFRSAEIEDMLGVLVKQSPRAKSEPGRIEAMMNGEIKNAVRSAEWKFTQEAFGERAGGKRLWSPFKTENMARIPLKALNPTMRDWAEERVKMIGVDPNGLLGAMLGAASSAADAGVELELAPGYSVNAWLWVMLVGEVSAKKTPAIKAATAELNRMTVDNVAAHSKAVKNWDEDVEENYKSVPKSQLPPFPIWTNQYATGDATLEALAGILSQQDSGICILIDELTSLLEGFGAYKSNGAKKEVAQVLELWDGNEKIVNRATGGRKGGQRTIIVKRWAAGIVGGIQTDKLKGLDAGLVRNGLLERFLPVIIGPATAGTMTGNMNLKTWDQTLQALTRIPEMTVRLDSDAMIAYSAFAVGIVELGQLPFHPGVQGALLKLQGRAGRLALVLHLIDIAIASATGKPAPDMAILPGDTMDRAIVMINEWAIPAIIAFWDVMTQGKDGSTIQAIARYILRNPKNEYAARDFKRGVRALRDADTFQIERALGQFEAGDWLKRLPDATKQHPKWIANNLIWEHFEMETKEAEEQAVAVNNKWKEWTGGQTPP